MEIVVTKKTDKELMLEACDKTFSGRSKQSLLSMYKSEHSPVRTQMFWVECNDIPLYVSTHLLRHHVGSQPFALTHRVDRKGGGLDLPTLVNEIQELMLSESPEAPEMINEKLETIKNKGGRMTPTNLGIWINAQSLIDMAKLRLCYHASEHTREIFEEIKHKVSLIDPDLACMMVKKCIYRNGLCGESCGYNQSVAWEHEMIAYLQYFSKMQQPKFSLLD